MELDNDLQSVQEVRNLIGCAKDAQKIYVSYSQKEVDQVVRQVALECESKVESLAKMAVEETGFGVWEDKVIKNLLGSRQTYEYIKEMKTTGIIAEEPEKGLTEIGVPMGIVAGLIPSTNPTSTVMYKALISLKAGNAIVFSPHPGAKKCILETVKIIRGALKKVNAPEDLVCAITLTTKEATNALIKSRDVNIILATGGEAMVRAAYSSGNPALGVGPGNGPAFIERTADIQKAVRHIVESKTFDNGTICASEQSIVTENCIEAEVTKTVEASGGYFLNEEESEKVSKLLLRENGTMNPQVVGKSVEVIAKMAGIQIPENTRILLSKQVEISGKNPYSREKLCPVLGFYTADNWKEACNICIRILENEGVGHTMVIHSKDDDIIRQFALEKPVSRLLVNTPGALGGVGGTTGLPPALTLGCGAAGGSATSDNVTPLHLINIRRVAYGTQELGEIRKELNLQAPHERNVIQKKIAEQIGRDISESQLEEITMAVLMKLKQSK